MSVGEKRIGITKTQLLILLSLPVYERIYVFPAYSRFNVADNYDYFFMIRPQNKKQKEIANFRKSLQVNQSVITAGGIHGTIKEITDDYIVLEIASNVKIKIDKNSIFADASAAGNQSK